MRSLLLVAMLAATAHADCPLEGDGGDPQLNAAKNRTDTPRSTLSLSVAEIAGFRTQGTKAARSRWSPAARARLAEVEGAAVRVDGFLLGAKREGVESPNCHDDAARDFHVWLADSSDAGHASAMIVEVTPRMHPASWTLAVIEQLAREHRRVRITGWLLYDQEHPSEVGRSRATLWEIHPITAIEVWTEGTWRPL